MKTRLSLLMACSLANAACSSISGLANSSATFACKAPDGVSCTSVSGVYANAAQNNLPALQSRASAGQVSVAVPTGGAFPLPAPGMPIRSQARMLRVWVAPWRDEEDTLHDQSYLYIVVDPGTWMVERSREATVQKTMARLRPLGKPRGAEAPGQPAHRAEPELPRVRDNVEAQASAREMMSPPDAAGDEK